MLWINPIKCLFYFFDFVWFDRCTPADVMIRFVYLFSHFSVTVIHLVRGIYISFFWMTCCPFAPLLLFLFSLTRMLSADLSITRCLKPICSHSVMREFTLRFMFSFGSSCNQIWWVKEPLITGFNPFVIRDFRKMCSSLLWSSQPSKN